MPKKLSILPPEVGGRLKELRLRLGFSQVDFADMVGITQATLSGMERGLSPVSSEVLYGLACRYQGQVDIYKLLCGKPAPVRIDAYEVASQVKPVIRAVGAPIDDLPPENVADDYVAVPMLDGKVAGWAGRGDMGAGKKPGLAL